MLVVVDLKQAFFMWNKIVDTSRLIVYVIITSFSNSHTLFNNARTRPTKSPDHQPDQYFGWPYLIKSVQFCDSFHNSSVIGDVNKTVLQATRISLEFLKMELWKNQCVTQIHHHYTWMWRKYFQPGIKYSSSLFLIRYQITFFLNCFNFLTLWQSSLTHGWPDRDWSGPSGSWSNWDRILTTRSTCRDSPDFWHGPANHDSILIKGDLWFLLAEYVIRIWILEHKGNIKSISLDISFNSIDHHKSNFNVISFKNYSRNIYTYVHCRVQRFEMALEWFWNGS